MSAMNHVEVRRVLPQRYPMILLDAVDAIDAEGGVIARKAITCAESCYAHVDAEDIEAFAYPLSLLMESFSHSVSIILERGWGDKLRSPDYVVLFGSMRRFQFHASAYPGDTLIHHGQVDWMNERSAVVSGHTKVGERVIASVDRITAFLQPVAPRGSEP